MNRVPHVIALTLSLILSSNASAYVEAPMPLSAVVAQSTIITLMTVTKVDKAQNIIIYQKVRDVKGKNPQEVIRHTIKGELKAGEAKEVMNWAEVGKSAVFFHNGSAGETCTGMNWYQIYPQGEWWGMSHGEPFLLRSFAGKPEKLVGLVLDIMAGKEVLVPCMVDGNKDDLHKKTAKIQRMKNSLKFQDYNPKRDFAGWGGEDIRRLVGVAGFSQIAPLSRVDAEAQSISNIDFDGDGKIDLCLASSSRVVLFQNQGDSYSEVFLPNLQGGCRSAVWADYNGDGNPDLLLATPTGPRLFTNLGAGQFRDDSGFIPREPFYNLTAASWIDADGDGLPDILLANGFHGMKLYKNKRPANAVTLLTPPKFGEWNYIGPFDNAGGKGFDTAFAPETEIDFAKQYDGKKTEKAVWKKAKFTDGSINPLSLFRPENNSDSVVYLYREIEATTPTELPLSLGSDDTLTVWCNGEKLLAENTARACTPDSSQVTLKLKPGKNTVLLKIGQGSGDWAFYFNAGQPRITQTPWFDDVTAASGLGLDSPASAVKADSLTVADFNGDQKPDFILGAGKPMLFINKGGKFELKADSGLAYSTAKVGPSVFDFDNDGNLDLCVTQNGKCLLYRNDGKGTFTNVADQAGDLAKTIPGATCTTWGDFNNDGFPDLFVGCVRGTNRYLENTGTGTFVDKSEEIGLNQRFYNTQAISATDINGDGKLDLILQNEGQDSAILFGNKELAGKGTSVSVHLPGNTIGLHNHIRVQSKDGKFTRSICTPSAVGRGGQDSGAVRFVLAAGSYQIEVKDALGKTHTKEVTLTDNPLKIRLDEKPMQAPPANPPATTPPVEKK